MIRSDESGGRIRRLFARRPRTGLGGVPLDVKLGCRMLVKHPGLTIVGGLAMAFAVWAGAITFEMVTQFVHPTLPLPDGHRIVQVRVWDAEEGAVEPRALRDYAVWRDALTSVTDIGAYRDHSRNLVAPGGDASPVQVAEITATAFRIDPSAPLLGRVLGPADERPGAPPVVVLGHDVWRTRFAGDAGVVGRSVRLGEAYATVVGVMPEGFGFPVSHDAWIPLQTDVLHQPPRDGPPVTVFGRLAPGVSLKEARVQLSVLGARMAAQHPGTHRHLRPQVVPYTSSYAELSPSSRAYMLSFNLFVLMLLVLVCGNVALLLFARASARETELVVRSALGATRVRIVAQLFAEALMLGAVAAAVGLTAAYIVLRRWGMDFLEGNLGRLPFWYDVRLSPAAVLYACGLTLLGAAIAGVLPALKITRGLGGRLRQATAGGGGVRFGGVWTAVIVTQVAFTVAFPAVTWVVQRELSRVRSFPAGFAAEQYLSAWLEVDAPAGADAGAKPDSAKLTATLEALRQRLAAEPGVAGVTFVDRLPRTGHVERYVELDEPAPAPGRTPPAVVPLREVSTARIDPSYFDVLRAPILAGRRFHPGDLAPDARAVIVDRGFVDQVLQGRSAVGVRVRFAREQRGGPLADDARPWYEIVGVVDELGMGAATQRGRAAGFYLPAAPGSTGPLYIVLHARGDPLSLAPRLREVAAAVDPALRISEVQRVDQVTSAVLWFLGVWLRITLALTGIALLLALAGIYSVLSFTVARRTREIGVRVALGASPRRVVAAVFRRPLTQVGLGVVAGGAVIAVAAFASSGGGFTARQVALLLCYAAFMLGVCLLACVVPTRRALRVEPTEALRAE